MNPRLAQLRPYLVALAGVLLALGVELALRPIFEDNPFLLFWPVLVLSGVYGGLAPSLFSIGLTVFLVNFFFLPPANTFDVELIDVARMAVFVVVAGLVSVLSTRQRQAENKRIETQRQLSIILGSISDGVTAQAPDGRLVYANHAAARITGFSSGESMVDTPLPDIARRFEMLDEDGNPYPVERLPGRRALHGEREPQDLIRFRRRDTGEEYWSLVKSTPVLDERGQVVMAINVFHDVTQMKDGQRAVTEQREWFRTTLTAIGDAVIATDALGRVDFMNPVAESMTGWSQRNALGRPIDEVFRIINEQTRQPADNPVERVLSEGMVVGLANHTVLIARDGTERAIDDSGAPIKDDHGRTTGAVLVFRDVSEQRKLDEQLRAANQTLQAIIDSAPLAIGVFNLDGTIRLWSPGAERMFGWTAEEVVGKLPPSVPESRLHEFLEMRDAASRGEIVIDREARRQRKDGSPIDISMSMAALYDQDGEVTGFVTIALDISERLRAEEAIRASHQELVNVLESISDAFYTLDREWRFTYINGQAEKLWNRRREELLGKSIWDIFSGTVGGEIYHAHQRAMANREIVEQEAFSKLLGFWISLRMYPNDNGLAAYFRDITEQKRAEITEKFLDEAGTLLASSLDYETTLNNVARLATPKIADWCAVDILSEDEEVQRVAVAHVNPEKIKWAYEIWEKYPVDLDAPTGLAKVLRTAESEFYPVITDTMIEAAARDAEHLEIVKGVGFRSAIIAPLNARGRTFGALTLVTTDESGRRLDEHDLRAAEELARRAAIAVDNARLYRDARLQREQLRVTLASIGDAVIATDADGRVTFMNEVAVSLTGWPLDDAYGKSLDDVFRIVNEETRAAVESPVSKVLRMGQIVGLANHTVLLARDGRQIPIDDSGAPIRDEDGTITGVVLVFRDISERKIVEDARSALLRQEQEARQAAEEADALKLKFLAMISHELRTPLTSIKGFTSTLLAPDVEWDAVMQREFVGIMDEEADKLVDLVEQLLDVSRLHAGTLRIETRLQPLTAAIDTAMAQMLALTNNHQFLLNIPEGLPPLNLDSQRIAQVLTNLVGNAAKYSPPHSRITLAARRVDDVVRVDVSDEGDGIAEADKDSIFEAFRQVGRKTGAQKGAGLGLAICKGLVEAHGGEIWVSASGPGGTTISFTLPVAPTTSNGPS